MRSPRNDLLRSYSRTDLELSVDSRTRESNTDYRDRNDARGTYPLAVHATPYQAL